MRIALAGNPNSGKTTLYNALTGKMEHVGNWAGVTVDQKEAKLRSSLNPSGLELIVIDLPGAYSMSPYTNEESITQDYILNANIDVIINVVDSTNLSRSLFFTTQLLELGMPVVVALNKSDLTRQKGNEINIAKLSELLDHPVIEISAVHDHEQILKTLIEKALIEQPHSHQYHCGIHRPGLGHGHGRHHRRGRGGHPQKAFQDRQRFNFVQSVVDQVEVRKVSSTHLTIHDRWDRVIANKYFGIPIFIFVIYLVFSLSQAWIGPVVADVLSGWINSFSQTVDSLMGTSVNPVLRSILLDGIIGGVGAVIGFLPLIMVLFFCLSLLEDCGYMARVAVIMDPFLKKVGLSGRSIIPMVIGTGCAIPGIMATRTIKSERQRRTTAMLTPFMPCGAKLPIIALFSGIFSGGNAWIGTSMYFMGIVIIILGALIIRAITGDQSRSFFIIELPEYRFPNLKRAVFSMFDRAKEFIIKAGTIILVCNVIVNIMQTFTWNLQIAATVEESILAGVASPIALLFVPLGFGLWQFSAATITGFIAKENVVGTLAVSFAITSFMNVDGATLPGGASSIAEVMGITSVAAMAYMVFNLFSPPCIAALGAMKAELKSTRWFVGAILFELGMGYVVAFMVYQGGTLLTTGALGAGFIPGLIAVMAMIGTVAYLIQRQKNKKRQIEPGVAA